MFGESSVYVSFYYITVLRTNRTPKGLLGNRLQLYADRWLNMNILDP